MLQQFRTNPDDSFAKGGLGGDPSDYSIHAIWGYRDHIKEYESGWFVSDASASYNLEWKFNVDTGTYFQIKITAEVMWAHVEQIGRDITTHYLVDDYKDTITQILTVYQ